MCLICVELIKQRMTLREAVVACKELIRTDNPDVHIQELYDALANHDFDKLDEIVKEDV